MANQHRKVAFFTLGVGLASLPLHASANGLIGTSVTGSATFNGTSTNLYDPANGLVPSGYLNASGTTVTIASPAVEFGLTDPGANTDTANFSASQFTIEDSVINNEDDAPFVMTFTDVAFTGLKLTKATDFFPDGGLTTSLSGNKITITWAGGAVAANDDYTSTFVFSAVPEPATWAAAGVGAGALALVLRRKRRALA